jgi:hypothetical protein
MLVLTSVIPILIWRAIEFRTYVRNMLVILLGKSKQHFAWQEWVKKENFEISPYFGTSGSAYDE